MDSPAPDADTVADNAAAAANADGVTDHVGEPLPPRTKGLRLDHFLKQSGVVETGGQAKLLIQAGEVCVNGQVETRRRCQLHPADTVRLGDIELTVGE